MFSANSGQLCDLEDARMPVLYNTWKHDAESLRRRIAACSADADLAPLASRLVVVGTDLMDLYTGSLRPAEIADKIVSLLQRDARLALDAYKPWLADAGGYRTVILGEDQSQWVLRLGDPAGRYVHVHPGRGTPHTRRVRANVLKTAVLVLAHVRVHGGDSLNVELINRVRQKYLSLSPIRGVEGDQGLGTVLALLGASPVVTERKSN